ncbi:hypothetical protein Bca52824_023713 [Brassica carinata]|uniref:Uncharacterized protein n=1 Tax=Brassica carinata TaxID=52824 RepID=A0A8X7VJ50_BRACI|nr:hypothetical protein Bca52824_023713 [Brassica carinata]
MDLIDEESLRLSLSVALIEELRQEFKMEGTVFTPCLQGMKHVKSEQGEMLTKPFLDLCKTILPVIGWMDQASKSRDMSKVLQ